MPAIVPNLWFDADAEEAAQFYCSVFKDSRVLQVLRCTEAGPGEPGSVLTVEWELDGQRFVGINGGPMFTFSEAISFQVDCADQAEVDYYWDALTADGGEESQCGWLKDKYGVSWQVVPVEAIALLSDPATALAATKALYTMTKLDLAVLRAAAG